MLIAGIILLVVAVGAAWYAVSQRRAERHATATETLTCADIAKLSEGVAAEVGGGSFHQRCEVVGRAEAGAAATTKAPESGVESLWHRTKVTHRYWVMEEHRSDGNTTRRRVERSETVSEDESEMAFVVADDSGTMVISPVGADIDHPEQVVDRFDRATVKEAVVEGLLQSAMRFGQDSGTLGFQHEEWVIRPGARLYVQGEVSDRTGELAFAKPQDGRPFLVSTRSEEEIVAETRRHARIAAGVSAVSAVVGVGLAIAGVVAAAT